MRRTHMNVLLLGILAAAVFGAKALHAANASHRASAAWGPGITAWHLPALGPNRVELTERQVGVGNYVDDTKVVTYTDVNGNTETTHSSRWTVMDVTRFGIPKSAKAIRLSLKGIITKGQSDGLATVYVMVRPYGSTCCQGPPGFRRYPVDFQLQGAPQVESALQTVEQQAVNGLREWSTVDVPLKAGKFEWAWGYRRVEGAWPSGDGVAFEMFVNGYGA